MVISWLSLLCRTIVSVVSEREESVVALQLTLGLFRRLQEVQTNKQILGLS